MKIKKGIAILCVMAAVMAFPSCSGKSTGSSSETHVAEVTETINTDHFSLTLTSDWQKTKEKDNIVEIKLVQDGEESENANTFIFKCYTEAPDDVKDFTPQSFADREAEKMGTEAASERSSGEFLGLPSEIVTFKSGINVDVSLMYVSQGDCIYKASMMYSADKSEQFFGSLDPVLDSIQLK